MACLRARRDTELDRGPVEARFQCSGACTETMRPLVCARTYYKMTTLRPPSGKHLGARAGSAFLPAAQCRRGCAALSADLDRSVPRFCFLLPPASPSASLTSVLNHLHGFCAIFARAVRTRRHSRQVLLRRFRQLRRLKDRSVPGELAHCGGYCQP